MNWNERAKYFEENEIYANDVLTCDVMKQVKIEDFDNYKKKILTLDHYEIIADYINDWLCSTSTDIDTANLVFNLLFKGLAFEYFTIENVRDFDSVVCEYINDRI